MPNGSIFSHDQKPLKPEHDAAVVFGDCSMQWQPISTAPKDGTEVLLFAPDDVPQIVVGKFFAYDGDGYGAFLYADEAVNEISPEGVPASHWMPLPAPPKL